MKKRFCILFLFLVFAIPPANAQTSTEENAKFYIPVSTGYYNFKDLGSVMDYDIGLLLNNRTFWIEISCDLMLLQMVYGPVARIFYPFSGKGDTFYFGGGGGYLFKADNTEPYDHNFSFDYNFYTESTVGYLTKSNISIFQIIYRIRIEITAKNLLNNKFSKNSTGFGMRLVMMGA
ncbi:MAG: hypothetical protein LBC75_06160 [Fibromonadaceae bacterium]|jgi:hypothetical protein|nr:hypothetical protein [Fibromonadaceae bacterium]